MKTEDLGYYEFTLSVAQDVLNAPFVEIGDNHLAKLAKMSAGLYEFPVLFVPDKIQENGEEKLRSELCLMLVDNEILYTDFLRTTEGVLTGKHDMWLGTYRCNFIEGTAGPEVKDVFFRLRKDYKEVINKWVKPKELKELISDAKGLLKKKEGIIREIKELLSKEKEDDAD